MAPQTNDAARQAYIEAQRKARGQTLHDGIATWSILGTSST